MLGHVIQILFTKKSPRRTSKEFMFPWTHFCMKLTKFHLYFTIYNLIGDTPPKNKVYFVNVQKAAVRVPAFLKKRELCECLSQNLLMASLLPHCLRWRIVVCHRHPFPVRGPLALLRFWRVPGPLSKDA